MESKYPPEIPAGAATCPPLDVPAYAIPQLQFQPPSPPPMYTPQGHQAWVCLPFVVLTVFKGIYIEISRILMVSMRRALLR